MTSGCHRSKLVAAVTESPSEMGEFCDRATETLDNSDTMDKEVD